MIGHGDGPGGTSGIFLDLLILFKRYLQKMVTKASIVSPAVVADAHLPSVTKLVFNFCAEFIFVSQCFWKPSEQ